MVTKRILLVEDEPILQLVSRVQLEGLGYYVGLAKTGHEAVMLALAQPFSAVLMDIGLPDISGIEACQKIRERIGKAKLPIIAYTTGNDEEAYLSAGMNAYLKKPSSLEGLKCLLGRYDVQRVSWQFFSSNTTESEVAKNAYQGLTNSVY